MSVRHLELADFRIFRTVSLDLEPEGTTVITGSNGSGKTSVLEALAYLGIRRSFRGAPPEAMVRTGAESAVVRAELDGRDSPTLVEAEILPAGRSRTRVNRKSVSGRRELAAAAPCTIFSPEDLVDRQWRPEGSAGRPRRRAGGARRGGSAGRGRDGPGPASTRCAAPAIGRPGGNGSHGDPRCLGPTARRRRKGARDRPRAARERPRPARDVRLRAPGRGGGPGRRGAALPAQLGR